MAKSKALVSVIMPVYNASKHVEEAVDSVLNQTFTDFELIVVNDGSKDDSLQILERLAQKDNRIRLLSNAGNKGVVYTRNRGIQEAVGKYIALIDSDDVWVEEKLDRQIELIKNTGAELVYSSYDFIDTNGKQIGRPFIVSEKTDYHRMLQKNEIGCSTVLIETKIIKAYMFNPAFYHEDYVLWLTLLSIPILVAGDKNVLMHYRKENGTRSNNKVNAAKHRWRIYRDALGMSVFSSGKAFISYAFWGFIKYYVK